VEPVVNDSEREVLTMRDAEATRALAAARAAAGEIERPPVRGFTNAARSGSRWTRLHDEELAPTWLGWMDCDL
jgi:hypothetical protein